MKHVRDFLQENPIAGRPFGSRSVVDRLEAFIPVLESEDRKVKQAAEVAEFGPEIVVAAERGWNKLRELNPKFDGPEFESFDGLPHPKKLEHLRFVRAAFSIPIVVQRNDVNPEPRVFNSVADVPDDVIGFRDSDPIPGSNTAFRVADGGWWWADSRAEADTESRGTGHNAGAANPPLTEILP